MTASGHTSGSVVVGVTAATTILAGLAVVSRSITRITVVGQFGADDVCILIAMVRKAMIRADEALSLTCLKALSVALTITMCEQGKIYNPLYIKMARAKERSERGNGSTLFYSYQ